MSETTMTDLVEDAINVAAAFVKQKEQKKEAKKLKKTKSNNKCASETCGEDGEGKSCEIVMEIEEGKKSSLLRSVEISNRERERRRGVMATNETEKALVKETIALMKIRENFQQLNL